MIDYAAIAQSSLDAIREAGTKLTGRRPSVSVEPVSGSVAGAFSAEGLFDGVVLPAKRSPFAVSSDDAAVENLRASKVRRLLLAAASAPFVPQILDEFLLEGATWEVTGSTPLSPAGTPLIYTVEVLKR